jgi:hypothetical protein
VLQSIRQTDDDPRDAVRANVFLTAILDASGVTYAVRVRNISVTGALIDGDQLPPNGASVRLSRGQLEACGEVAWEDGDYRGLRFSSPVDVQAWVKKVGHNGQREVDQKLALLRQPGRKNPIALVVDDRSSADTPHRVSVDLDSLCEELAACPRMSVEFGEQLIRIDTIAQRLRKIIEATG